MCTHAPSTFFVFQPSNILVCEDDGDIVFKIGDVGISTSKSKAKSEIGSQVYMAPEVSGRSPYTEKVDLFSFGITLAEVVFTALCR